MEFTVMRFIDVPAELRKTTGAYAEINQYRPRILVQTFVSFPRKRESTQPRSNADYGAGHSISSSQLFAIIE